METYILNHYLSPVHCVLLLAVFLIVFFIWHLIAKKSLTHSLLISLFVTYIFFILLITLIARTPAVKPDGTLNHRAELIPFWSWYEVIVNHSRSLAVEILLNILLFVPVGILGRSLNISFRRIFGISLFLSLAIELTQYFTCLGLMEWDDIVHNTVGACVGWLVCDRMVPWIKTTRSNTRTTEKEIHTEENKK